MSLCQDQLSFMYMGAAPCYITSWFGTPTGIWQEAQDRCNRACWSQALESQLGLLVCWHHPESTLTRRCCKLSMSGAFRSVMSTVSGHENRCQPCVLAVPPWDTSFILTCDSNNSPLQQHPTSLLLQLQMADRHARHQSCWDVRHFRSAAPRGSEQTDHPEPVHLSAYQNACSICTQKLTPHLFCS